MSITSASAKKKRKESSSDSASQSSITPVQTTPSRKGLGAIILNFIKTVPLEIVSVLIRPKDPQAAKVVQDIVVVGGELQQSLRNTSFLGVPGILRNALAAVTPLIGNAIAKGRTQKEGIEIVLALTRVISIIPSALSGALQRRAYALMLQDHIEIVRLVKQEVQAVGLANGWVDSVKNTTTDIILAAIFAVAVAIPAQDADPTDEDVAESEQVQQEFLLFAQSQGLVNTW